MKTEEKILNDTKAILPPPQAGRAAKNLIQVENKYYIATNSSYADKRTLLLNDSDTFGVFDRWGDIIPFVDQLQGIYHEGTRFLSESEFLINGEHPTLLSSSVKEENDLLSADLTTEAFPAM